MKNLKLINDIIEEAKNKLIKIEGESELTLKLKGAQVTLNELIEPKKNTLVDSLDGISDESVLKVKNKNGHFFGNVGEETDHEGFNVGDIVETRSNFSGLVKSMVVVNQGVPTVYGWSTERLAYIEEKHGLKLIKKFDDVSFEDLTKLKYSLTFSR